MNLRSLLLLALAAGMLARSAAGADASPRKLNVLFIAVDDLNNRLGCYGDPIVKTPNIDRLAARGVRFDRAYCQFPLCNPSRTSFLSGRYPPSTGILGNGTPPREHLGAIAFLPEYFQQNGYFTAKAGKIPHGAFDTAVKWDATEKEAATAPAEGQAATRRARRKAAAAQQQPEDSGGLPASVVWQATDQRDEETADGQAARRVVTWLEQPREKPFFLAAGFHKPHRPYVAPKKYFADYPADKMPLAKQAPDGGKDVPAIALNRYAGDDKLTDQQKRNAIAAYHACITFMDAQVGLLLDALDRGKLWDNTVVVFASDHGYHLGEHGGMWRKMSLFEESARVPLIIAAPGKRAGAPSPRTVGLIDLFPTLTELCGLPPPGGLEGTSLVPLLAEPGRAWDRPAFSFVTRQSGLGRRVRTERYAYTEWPDGSAMLFDHEKDSGEFNNLAADPAHAGTREELKRLLPPAPAEGKRGKK